MTSRANALAVRLEHGAQTLADLARDLTDAEWRTPLLRDGRPIGVVVHHVASVYPVEIQLAQTLASGQPITGVTMDDVHQMNAAHARDNGDAAKEAALTLLRTNAAAAAAAIRALSDAELDRAAPASLYGDAPVTCQFLLEDHAVRHSYHHLARIRSALGARAVTA
jgi:DinB superfamily